MSALSTTSIFFFCNIGLFKLAIIILHVFFYDKEYTTLTIWKSVIWSITASIIASRSTSWIYIKLYDMYMLFSHLKTYGNQYAIPTTIVIWWCCWWHNVHTPLYWMRFEEKLGQNKQKTHFLTGKDSCRGACTCSTLANECQRLSKCTA
jgi:hypothetical protein